MGSVRRRPLWFLRGHVGVRAELLELPSPWVPSSGGQSSQRGSEGMAAGRGWGPTPHTSTSAGKGFRGTAMTVHAWPSG